ILEARTVFVQRGIQVTSPEGNAVIREGIDFVRFEKEFEDWDDPSVQAVALHRILRADAVFVVVPGGYIGRTTCYEVGRIIQAARPVYFSEHPNDLPVFVPKTQIVSAKWLAEAILSGQPLKALHADGEDRCSQLERKLLARDYISD